MSEDLRVIALVQGAAPSKFRIRDALECCPMTGRKHTYTIVVGGTGAQKESIGLILNVCPNPRGSQCGSHQKPLKVQMSVANRTGLLLDLAILDPPPFRSEDFARWCCQATMSLIAREIQALKAPPPLAPGSFLAFTPSIPGMDDLPHMNDNSLGQPAQALTRVTPIMVNEGEEVDVVVMIYEMDRVGPFRIVAKGKKLGALVGFTFRQPAILQALGLPPNSRDLGAYLMYEPFQQAWTRALKPSQTLTLCGGGGVMYRHPRVKVTLWLDRYVKDIYPDWARNGSRLPDLVALATDSFLPHARTNLKPILAAKPASTNFNNSPGKNIPSGRAQKPIPSLASPRVAAPLDKSADSVAKNTRARSAQKLPLPLVEPGLAVLDHKSPTDSGVKTAEGSATSKRTVGKDSHGGAKDRLALPSIPKPNVSMVIDLTIESDANGKRKRKRSLVASISKVDVRALGDEHNVKAKRRRRMAVKGKGTAEDPYVL